MKFLFRKYLQTILNGNRFFCFQLIIFHIKIFAKKNYTKNFKLFPIIKKFIVKRIFHNVGILNGKPLHFLFPSLGESSKTKLPLKQNLPHRDNVEDDSLDHNYIELHMAF